MTDTASSTSSSRDTSGANQATNITSPPPMTAALLLSDPFKAESRKG